MTVCRMGPERSEALLITTEDTVGGLPTIRCSNCNYEADHFFWYEDASYADRRLRYCPMCGMPILGVVVRDA